MSRVTSDGKMSPVDQPNKQPVTQRKFFLFSSLFLRGGVPSPNFLKLFMILWKFYTADNFYDFQVLYMTYL